MTKPSLLTLAGITSAPPLPTPAAAIDTSARQISGGVPVLAPADAQRALDGIAAAVSGVVAGKGAIRDAVRAAERFVTGQWITGPLEAFLGDGSALAALTSAPVERTISLGECIPGRGATMPAISYRVQRPRAAENIVVRERWRRIYARDRATPHTAAELRARPAWDGERLPLP